MAFLLDTNVLARLASAGDVRYAVAAGAVATLHRRGEVLYLTPQNLIEFRALATRPVGANGLGLAAVNAEAKAADFEAQFSLLPDVPAVFPAWKRVVEALGVVGRQVHDARLVAVCHAHGVSHLLTFDVAHFRRLTGFGPTVTIVDPATV
jgi:predicted nucleic acid-binding protein